MTWHVIAIDQVAIRIVFHNETVSIIPVIENLATQEVPSNTPNQLPAALLKPGMTLEFAIKVIDLETGVVGLVSALYIAGR